MKKSATLLLILLMISPVLNSQNRWTKLNGPEGGSITSLIARGDTIIAGTGWEHGLIFYSTNRGLNWTKGDFKNNERVADFDFTNDGGVLAAADNAGIIKSFDLHNWFNLHPGGVNYEFWSVGAGENGKLYASTDAPISYLWSSTDNGSTWNQIAYLDGPVYDFQYFNGSMYLTYNKYILRKTEPAGNWDTVFVGFNNRITLTTDNQNTIFAPSWNYFHVSTDLGNTWEQRDTSHYLYYNHLNGCIFNNRLLGAVGVSIGFGDLWGIILSDDRGFTWRMSNNGLMPKIDGFKLASSGNECYLGTNADGVYKSTDYGDSWSPLNNGLTAAYTRDISFDPDGILYSANWSNGFQKSTDDGESWTAINNGLTTVECYSIISDDNGILFGGTRGGGIFYSTNSGENWMKVIGDAGNNFAYKFYKDDLNRRHIQNI